MEGDDEDVALAALVDAGAEEEVGVAATAGFGGGVEVEEVGAGRLEVDPVGWEVLEEDAGGGEDFFGCFVFEEEADVGAGGEVAAEPGVEVGVHCGEVGFGGEVVVGEHDVAVAGDEVGVVEGGEADVGHRDRITDVEIWAGVVGFAVV